MLLLELFNTNQPTKHSSKKLSTEKNHVYTFDVPLEHKEFGNWNLQFRADVTIKKASDVGLNSSEYSNYLFQQYIMKPITEKIGKIASKNLFDENNSYSAIEVSFRLNNFTSIGENTPQAKQKFMLHFHTGYSMENWPDNSVKFKILSTMREIIENRIFKKPDNIGIFYFSADSDESSKVSAYQKMLNRLKTKYKGQGFVGITVNANNKFTYYVLARRKLK